MYGSGYHGGHYLETPEYQGPHLDFQLSKADLAAVRTLEYMTVDIPGPRAKNRSYVTSEMENARASFVRNARKGSWRDYGALRVNPSEFSNAGIAVGTTIPYARFVRKQRTKDVIPKSKDPMREEFRKRNTVRGFDSPHVIKKARTAASGTRDARGEMVSVNRHIRGHRGRVHGDKETEMREKSMKQVHTIPDDVVVKGRDGASIRTRSVRRSTRIHEKEMRGVLAYEGL